MPSAPVQSLVTSALLLFALFALLAPFAASSGQSTAADSAVTAWRQRDIRAFTGHCLALERRRYPGERQRTKISDSFIGRYNDAGALERSKAECTNADRVSPRGETTHAEGAVWLRQRAADKGGIAHAAAVQREEASML